ncbi:citrate synthase, partial [Aureobasidium pullulans]
MTTTQQQRDQDALKEEFNISSDPDAAPVVPSGSHEKTEQNVVSTIEQPTDDNEVYSVFTPTQKKLIVLTASLAGFFSPLSGSIYYPSLNTIAEDLGITATKVNLTVTTYMIVQGLAPMLTAGFSDGAGRRPAYIACFVIYLAANLGLALQNNYAALLVLRCLQSGGSSGTIALANGVVGDIVTSAERGSYVAFASVSSILGPTLSPILGGLLSQYWNWH